MSVLSAKIRGGSGSGKYNNNKHVIVGNADTNNNYNDSGNIDNNKSKKRKFTSDSNSKILWDHSHTLKFFEERFEKGEKKLLAFALIN